jgi:large subunit ribosomal protein L1
MRRGKKYIEKQKLVDRSKVFSPSEALSLLRQASYAKFDETVELHFNLGIDPRHSDQQLRGTLTLPKGTGKAIKIAVIAGSDKLNEARQAGADHVGSEDLVEKIQGGWLDFDLVITTPDMMAKVGKLGKILGAKGLMPNPKSGTVTTNLEAAIKEFKAGKLEYKNDKAGLVHIVIGKLSFPDENLRENFDAVYETVVKAKPAKSKGIYIKSISLCSTMSPGLFIEPLKVKWKEA